METINSIMNFLFSWKGYFTMMPIWFTLMIIFIKWCSHEVWVKDVISALFVSIINPFASAIIIIMIILFPIIFIDFYIDDKYGWNEIRNKKLF